MSYCNQVKPSMLNTTDQLLNLNQTLKEKRPQYAKRHDKVILLHDNARCMITTCCKTDERNLRGTWMGCFTRPIHPPYSPDVVPSDFYLFRSMQHGLSEQHFNYIL